MPMRFLSFSGFMGRTLFSPRILVFRVPPNNYLFDNDRNPLRYQRRFVRYVPVVTQQQLQGVLARFELQLGRAAAVAEVDMPRIGGYRLPKVREVRVHDQVVMPRVRRGIAGPDDAHPFDTEFDGYRAGNRVAVGGCYEKDPGTVRRRCARYCGCFDGCLRRGSGLGRVCRCGGRLSTVGCAGARAQPARSNASRAVRRSTGAA